MTSERQTETDQCPSVRAARAKSSSISSAAPVIRLTTAQQQQQQNQKKIFFSNVTSQRWPCSRPCCHRDLAAARIHDRRLVRLSAPEGAGTASTGDFVALTQPKTTTTTTATDSDRYYVIFPFAQSTVSRHGDVCVDVLLGRSCRRLERSVAK